MLMGVGSCLDALGIYFFRKQGKCEKNNIKGIFIGSFDFESFESIESFESFESFESW